MDKKNLDLIEILISLLCGFDLNDIKGHITIENRKPPLQGSYDKIKEVDLFYSYMDEKNKRVYFLNIELNNHYNKNLIKRNLTYLSSLECNQSKNKLYKDYEKLFLQVNLDNFSSSKVNRKFKNIVEDFSYSNTHGELSNMTRIYLVDMTKAYESFAKSTREYKVACLSNMLNSTNAKDFRKYGKEIYDMNTLEKSLNEVRKFTRNNPTVIERGYSRIEDELIDNYNSGVSDGKEIGKAEGIAVGKAEGIKENTDNIAIKMLKMKLPIDVISSITGLSISKIHTLL